MRFPGRDVAVFYRDLVAGVNTSDYVLISPCDGKARKTSRGLIIDSATFIASRPQGMLGPLDHIKWLCFYRDLVTISGDETIYETVMSACQLFNYERPVPHEFKHRLRNIHEDYRLCSSAMVLRDESTMVEAMFLLTNDTIYALYQRHPSEILNLRTIRDGPREQQRQSFASFSAVVPVARRGYGSSGSRDLLDDTYRLGIGIGDAGTSIRWYINRQEVHRVSRIGYRLQDQYQVVDHGGTPHLAVISSFKCGFGHYTFLDHQLPNNYAREHVHIDVNSDPSCQVPRSESGLVMLGEPDSYREVLPDLYGRHGPVVPSTTFAVTADNEKYRLFGQGVVTCLKSLHVYHRHLTGPCPSLKPSSPRRYSPPRHIVGNYRNDDSLMTRDDMETVETDIDGGVVQQLGGKMQLEENGTPVVRRSFHTSQRRVGPNYVSQEPHVHRIEVSAEGEALNFHSPTD